MLTSIIRPTNIKDPVFSFIGTFIIGKGELLTATNKEINPLLIELIKDFKRELIKTKAELLSEKNKRR